MSYKQGTSKTMLAISGGYAEVLDNVMTVLAPTAEFAAEIDIPRAQQAKEHAEKLLAELSREDKEWKMAEAALQKALVRLQVASKEARR
jgi:F-type H+-transporting ATPase subunit epsilon